MSEEKYNKKVRKSMVHTIVGTVAVLFVALFFVNFLMNKIYFDPYKFNKGSDQKMLCVLRDYLETTRPYREMVSLDVDKKGFGRYDFALQIVDVTEPIMIGYSNVKGEINLGKYENVDDPERVTSYMLDRFEFDDGKNPAELKSDIGDLPKSSVIYLSVSDSSLKSLEELRNAPVELDWMQIYQPNVKFQGGLSTHMVSGYSEDDFRQEMTEEEMKAAYISNLKNLLEHQEVWSSFGLSNAGNVYYQTEEVLTETYEHAKNIENLESKNYCIHGKRDEVIRFLEENTLESVYVDKVRLW